jgi:hypothetical protein
MLARKLEKALRRRYQVGDDLALGAVVRQAARHAALAEALSEALLEGDEAAQRATQTRWVAATRCYRKAIDLLEAVGRVSSPRGREGLSGGLAEQLLRLPPLGSTDVPDPSTDVPDPEAAP